MLAAAAQEQAVEDELAQQRAASGRRPCCAKRLAQQSASAEQVATSSNSLPQVDAVKASSAPVARDCCRAKTATARQCCDRGVQSSAPRSAFTWVLMIQAQRCQGESGGLFAVCAAAPPPVPVVSPVEFALQGTMFARCGSSSPGPGSLAGLYLLLGLASNALC